MSNRKEALLPIVDINSKILILGSMPGEESLRKQQYYANKRNAFWKIIFSLYERDFEEDYDSRIGLLKEKGIALWDVIESCNREGSLDSDIKDEKVNDFNSFFSQYPEIKTVAFNGTKAYETFRKKVGFEGFDDIKFIKLTSTSPANTISFQKKLENWASLNLS